MLRIKFTESECFFQKLSLVLRLLGFVASARSSPPSHFPPSLPLLSSFFAPFFFLEGQVLTSHCLLATASTSLSNRSAGCGPHQDEREEKATATEATTTRSNLVIAQGEKRQRGLTGQVVCRGRGAGRQRGQRAQGNLRWKRGEFKGIRPTGKVERAWNGERDLVDGGGESGENGGDAMKA